LFSWWRARKKKVLINLPFVNRIVRKVPEIPKDYPKKEDQPTVAKEDPISFKANSPKSSEPKTKETDTPVQLVNIENIVLSNSVSINSKSFAAEQEKKKDEEVDLSNRPTDEYSIELFKEKWNAYKDALLKKGKVSLVTVFEYLPPINNDIIELLVENKALVEEFNHHKADFIEYIRTSLNNYNIQVEIQINKEFKTKKAYTPQEKYDKMLEKNPTLDLLKRKLDMDVGYI
jgi:DNA polymerase III subunit gamma/tau